jgi:hypothetical protein
VRSANDLGSVSASGSRPWKNKGFCTVLIFLKVSLGFGPRFAFIRGDEGVSESAAVAGPGAHALHEARACAVGERISVPQSFRDRPVPAPGRRPSRRAFEKASIVTIFTQGVVMRASSSLRFVSPALACGLVLFASLPAFATSIINLGTGISETVAPGTSGSFTFTLSNVGTSATPDNFIGWVLGVQLVPRVGNTGSLTVGSLSGGATNPMPFGDLDITQPVLSTLGNSATINGSTQYYFMGINTLDSLGTVAVGQTYEMGSLGLTASGDASGIWDVYTVQQNSPLFKTYFFDGGATEQPFGNLPWVGGGNYSLKLGEVAAVPEPSTLAMLGFAGLGAGGYAWRRRGRRLAVAGGTVVA